MEELTFNDHIMQQATYLIVWVHWLLIINLSSIIFIWKHVEARYVLGAMLFNLPLIMYLFDTFGWVRILGLSHIIVWTPLLIYLWLRRENIKLKTSFGVYITTLFFTDAFSLVIDYIDLVRYFVGDVKLS